MPHRIAQKSPKSDVNTHPRNGLVDAEGDRCGKLPLLKLDGGDRGIFDRSYQYQPIGCRKIRLEPSQLLGPRRSAT